MSTPQIQTWFDAEFRYGRFRLKAVKVNRSTDANVWVDWYENGKFERKAKSSDYHNFFPSYEEAVAFIEKKMAAAIKHAEEELRDLNKVKGDFYVLQAEGKCTS